MDTLFKEVDFKKYCPLCEYEKKLESEDPCYDCLACPAQQNTHKPLYFKEKSNVGN